MRFVNEYDSDFRIGMSFLSLLILPENINFLKALEADFVAAEVKKGKKREKKDIAAVGDRSRNLSLTRPTR